MLPRDIRRLIVGFIACGGPEIISEKLKQYGSDKRKMFDVLDASTLGSTIAGYELSIHLRRTDTTDPWSLMCFWSKEDVETGDFLYTAQIVVRLSDGKIPSLLDMAPRDVTELPPLIVRAFDERDEGPMISTEYF